MHLADDPNWYLYHYTGTDTARLILSTNRLLLSSVSRTSDPRERRRLEFGLALRSDQPPPSNQELDEIPAWFASEIGRCVRLACFTTDAATLSGNYMADIYLRGFARSRMWAQYARGHAGVCLVFERHRLLDAATSHLSADLTFSGSVRYADHNPLARDGRAEYWIDFAALKRLGRDACFDRHVKQHHRTLFFEKLRDWRDESEFRILTVSKSATDLYLPIEGCIAGVMHGDATPVEESRQLISLTKGSAVVHNGLSWRNGYPWYDFGSFALHHGSDFKLRGDRDL
jgi:hypothetical protein